MKTKPRSKVQQAMDISEADAKESARAERTEYQIMDDVDEDEEDEEILTNGVGDDE